MKNKKIFTSLLTVFVLGVVFFFTLSVVRPTWRIDESEMVFEIEKGKSVAEIGESLEKEGIISSRYSFLGYLVLSGKTGNIQAGTYNLNSDMSVVDLVYEFKNGNVSTNKVTIVEGWNLREIANILEAEGLIDRNDFFEVTGLSEPQAGLEGISQPEREEFDFDILNDLENSSLEGYLFPDTYRFTSESEREIVKTMVRNFESRLKRANLFEEINESELTIHEVITMASLIEKEVPDPDEMKMVSDILWRRAEVGMPLQVDATVNYITGRRGIDVTIDETNVNSPFNTYQILGLPKGPIASPSISSLEAALNPKSNEYWYYLSDPETGDTIFSRNHLEHVRAKNKYLR